MSVPATGQRIAGGIALGLIVLAVPAQAVFLPGDPTKQNCEWLAICPASLEAQMQPLRDFRALQGHSACIWTLTDIDDTYGSHGREQIKQALTWARAAWGTKPRWVLLVGEHFAGGGAGDIISDWNESNAELGYWEPNIRGLWPYMDLNDDGTPEMAVGRLPAKSLPNVYDAANYVAKAIRHDQDIIAHSGYTGSALLVQDVDLGGKSGSFVRILADSIYDTYDVMPNKRRLYASSIGPYPYDLALAADAEWDLGPDHVIAMGTASIWFQLVGFWNLAEVFLPFRWNPGDLAPTYRYPVLLGLSCGINGTDQPVTNNTWDGARSITEQLLFYSTPGSGAAAVIAPSRSTIQYWNALIGKHLLMQRGSAVETWGEVFSHAMENAQDEDPAVRDHVYQYVFEGDPALLTGALTGGGGGCPVVDARGNDGWREENTVLARSPDGTFGEDLYRLKGPPTAAVGPLELRIRENGQEFTRLDQAQVVVVDHDPGLGAFAVGRNVVLGTLVPAARVRTSSGEDLTDRVSGWGSYFLGGPGDTLVVEFTRQETGVARAEGATDGPGDPGMLEGDPKEMEIPQRALAGPPNTSTTDDDVLNSTGIIVQKPDGMGGWRTFGHYYPRQYRDTAAWDSLGDGAARLVFVGHHRLFFVGKIAAATTQGSRTTLDFLSARHSRLGSVKSALQAADGTAVRIVPGDTLTMAFSYGPVPPGRTRHWFFRTRGLYTSTAPAQGDLDPDSGLDLPREFHLAQNQPNPAGEHTTIRFDLPIAQDVYLAIYDVQGRLVRVLVNRRVQAGFHSVEWDGRDNSGRERGAGIYMYQIRAGTYREDKKLVLLP